MAQHIELRRALLSAAIGLSTYYLARALGAHELQALVLSAATSAVRVAYSAIRHRKFDVIACFLMLVNCTTVAVGFSTRSTTLTMLSGNIPGVFFGAFVIASLVAKRPATELIVS